jgi:hypothetical protein
MIPIFRHFAREIVRATVFPSAAQSRGKSKFLVVSG